MYTLTLIRLNSNTRVFENTEYHSICLLEDIERALSDHNVDFDQVEKVLNLQKGNRITVETTKEDKMWFYYINKIS